MMTESSVFIKDKNNSRRMGDPKKIVCNVTNKKKTYADIVQRKEEDVVKVRPALLPIIKAVPNAQQGLLEAKLDISHEQRTIKLKNIENIDCNNSDCNNSDCNSSETSDNQEIIDFHFRSLEDIEETHMELIKGVEIDRALRKANLKLYIEQLKAVRSNLIESSETLKREYESGPDRLNAANNQAMEVLVDFRKMHLV